MYVHVCMSNVCMLFIPVDLAYTIIVCLANCEVGCLAGCHCPLSCLAGMPVTLSLNDVSPFVCCIIGCAIGSLVGLMLVGLKG